MALLMFDGFEFAPTVKTVYGAGTGITAVTGRDGVGKAIRGGTADVLMAPPSPVNQMIFGLGIWTDTYNATIIQVFGDGGGTTHLTLGVSAIGQFTVWRGPALTGTLLATGTTVLGLSRWHWIEAKMSIADAGGICIVKVNGVTEINFTGDTKNAGTLTTISNLRLQGSANVRFDDAVICDNTGSAPFNDFFGEKVIRLKTPIGNGAVNQWIGSDADSLNNYLLVDDNPIVTTDYTGSSTAGERDLYTLSSISGMSSVDAIQNVAHVAKSDAGARSVMTVTRNAGGTVKNSPAIALSTTYGLVGGGVELTDPSAATWTPTNVNTIQAGVECV